MKVLVTGGAGFIGSNLVKLLLEEGHSVRVIDDLSSGHAENLRGLDVEFINDSILSLGSVEQACKGVDVVFHMAASVGRQRSIDFPQKDSEINLIGTVNVLESMKKNNVGRIVYSSSAAIFGELVETVIDENHPLNADSPYGVSKLAAEKMILAYSGIYGFTGVCLRYFNIYGVNQRFDKYGNVIPIFANRIFNKLPLCIYGDGEQTRDFVNVKDVARANYLAATKATKSDVFNLGSGEVITINNLAKFMLDYTDSNLEIQYLPERPADVKHCKADASKVLKDLGFKTTVALEDGLKDYMDWYKKELVK